MKKTIGIILAVITLFAITLGVIYLINDDTAYVFLDVNPNIELIVNKKNITKEIYALNEEAEILLIDMDLKDKDILDVIDILSSEMIATGFINQTDYKLIDLNTVSGKEVRNEKLNSSIKKRLEENLAKKNIIAEVNIDVVNGDIQDDAEKNDISIGKMLMVAKALEAGTSYSKSELVRMSIKNIQEEIKTNSQKPSQENKEALLKEKELRKETIKNEQ